MAWFAAQVRTEDALLECIILAAAMVAAERGELPLTDVGFRPLAPLMSRNLPASSPVGWPVRAGPSEASCSGTISKP